MGVKEMKKSSRPNLHTCVLGTAAVIALLALFTGLYAVRTVRSLRNALADTQARLAQSEEARISGLYNLERSLGSLRQEGTSDGSPSEENFAEALRAGKIESVLVLGDSISDGNGDYYCVYSHAEREEKGFRRIMTDGENSYFENDPRSQGWVRYFREYLLENTAVTVVHNNAIGGMSAKWFNTHKEAVVPQDYDAIVVMLGTNDRGDCSGPEEFYVEYAALLMYLEGRCKYLQVLTPIPAFDSAAPSDTIEYRMDTRQAADTVLELCADQGYACANLYSGMLWYAQTADIPLDEVFFGGVHPRPSGYLHLWRLIAGELGLNLDIGIMYDDGAIREIMDIGVAREEVTEGTGIYDVYLGEDIFPVGISLYCQGYGDPFVSGEEHGGTIITYRYENGGGKQIHKPLDRSYDLIRYVNADGSWSVWHKVNQDLSAPEA